MSQRSIGSTGNGDNHSEAARSRSRHSFGASSNSKISMAIAMAKAKAEAAQARASHSKKEIELKVDQARIQASLDALKEEKDKDAAIAEANCLVAGLQDMGFEVRSEANDPVPQSMKDQQTAAFVSAQASLRSNGASAIMESDNALQKLHLSRLQSTGVNPSTLYPHNESQTHAAASATIMPHHSPQAPQWSTATIELKTAFPISCAPARAWDVLWS